MRCRPTCLHPSGPSRAARAGSGSGRRGRVVKVPVARADARGRSGHPEQGGRCPGGPLLVADQAAPRVRPVAAVRRARQLVRRRRGGLSAAVSVPIADLSTKAWAAHQLPPGESGSRDSAACNTWPTAGPDSSDSSSAAALGPCGTAADGRSDWRSCCLPSRNGQRARVRHGRACPLIRSSSSGLAWPNDRCHSQPAPAAWCWLRRTAGRLR